MELKTDRHLFDFGPYRLDTAERVLLREGRPVPLTLKALDVLIVLVRRAGHVVDKDTLLKEVWADTFVEEANLSRQVWTLRKTLEDGGDASTYIETVPKRGYRFRAPVTAPVVAPSFEVEQTTTTTTILAEETIVGGGALPHTDLAPAARALPAPTVWSRRWLVPALTLGVAVALAVAGVWAVRGERRDPLTDRDTLVLADFENSTGDAVFDDTLRQALAVALEQSPFLQIVPEARVRETLRMMARSSDEQVTAAVAREIAQRVGAGAVLAGTIARLDGRYVVTLEAVHPESSETLARVQTAGGGKEQVLSDLGAATARVRAMLGESRASVRKFNAPLQEATTSSLEALKAFSAGMDRSAAGKHREAASLYQRAIELDPDFVLAHVRLSAAYANLREPALGADHARKAFERRARATEHERFQILVRHQVATAADFATRIATLIQFREAYPRDALPRRTLSSLYLSTGRFELAADEARAAIELEPRNASAHTSLVIALMCLNRLREARAAVDGAVADNVASSAGRAHLFELAVFAGDETTVQKQLEWARLAGQEDVALYWQAQQADYRGQRRLARELYGRTIAFQRAEGGGEAPMEVDLMNTAHDALVGLCDGVPSRATQTLAIATNRNTTQLATMALALCGETAAAERIWLAHGRFASIDTYGSIDSALEAIVASSGGDHQRAVAAADRILPAINWYRILWPEYVRGIVYLRAGDAQRARGAFQVVLDHRGAAGLSIRYPLSHLGLARAAAAAGDVKASRAAYESFLAMWKDADPDLPVMRQARAEFMQLR